LVILITFAKDPKGQIFKARNVLRLHWTE